MFCVICELLNLSMTSATRVVTLSKIPCCDSFDCIELTRNIVAEIYSVMNDKKIHDFKLNAPCYRDIFDKTVIMLKEQKKTKRYLEQNHISICVSTVISIISKK